MVFGSVRHAALHLRRPKPFPTPHQAAASASTFRFDGGSHATVAFVQTHTNTTQVSGAQHQYVKADATGVVAGIAIVGALISVGKMWWDNSAAPSSEETKVIDFQEIPQAEIAAFFTELTAAIRDLFSQVLEVEKAVRKHLKDNNHELSDTEFQQAVLSQLYQMIEGIEQQISNRRKWSRQSLEFALEKYAQDAEILKLQDDLNSLMQTVFPAPKVVEIPDNLTADTTLAILKEIVAGMEKAMSDMLAHAWAEGIHDVQKAMEEFQYLYMEYVEQATQAQMKTHGISQEIFTAALQKYHTENDQFRQQVEQIYTEQAKAFQEMGLPVEIQ